MNVRVYVLKLISLNTFLWEICFLYQLTSKSFFSYVEQFRIHRPLKTFNFCILYTLLYIYVKQIAINIYLIKYAIWYILIGRPSFKLPSPNKPTFKIPHGHKLPTGYRFPPDFHFPSTVKFPHGQKPKNGKVPKGTEFPPDFQYPTKGLPQSFIHPNSRPSTKTIPVSFQMY